MYTSPLSERLATMSVLKNLRERVSDHPARHMAENALLHLPMANWLQEQRWRAKKTSGAMNDPPLMAEWARCVIEAARESGLDINGATVGEIGPGHSLGVAASLLLAGAELVVAIDVRALADPNDIAALEPIVPELRHRGVIPADAAVDLRQAVTNLRYSIVSHTGSWNEPSESMDIVYSFYSGEHLRAPEIVLAEAYRTLKPGGLCIQRIDLQDHYHSEGNWLQFLYHDTWMWELMHSKRGRWCNRIRAPEWRRLFEQHFDELLLFEEKERPLPDEFDPRKLSSEFRHFDLDVLSVCGLFVVARKAKRTQGFRDGA
jgi:SAM-dependent methyltransferase